MGIEALREALAEAKRDTFNVGDVISWKAAGRYNYAAIKTEIGWATTARAGNRYVGDVIDFDELVEALRRSEVTEVKVATEWENIG